MKGRDLTKVLSDVPSPDLKVAGEAAWEEVHKHHSSISGCFCLAVVTLSALYDRGYRIVKVSPDQVAWLRMGDGWVRLGPIESPSATDPTQGTQGPEKPVHEPHNRPHGGHNPLPPMPRRAAPEPGATQR